MSQGTAIYNYSSELSATWYTGTEMKDGNPYYKREGGTFPVRPMVELDLTKWEIFDSDDSNMDYDIKQDK